MVRSKRTFPAGRRRGGAVTLELILVLPVWLIGLLAVIEFGSLLGTQQQVALASRVGAQVAARTPGLPIGGQVPPLIVDAITSQLTSSGIDWCRVILQHNVGGTLRTLETTPGAGACNCTPSSFTPPNVSYSYYVRVTVCVPLTELVPNLLGAFGLDLSTCTVQQSTTFCYELASPN